MYEITIAEFLCVFSTSPQRDVTPWFISRLWLVDRCRRDPCVPFRIASRLTSVVQSGVASFEIIPFTYCYLEQVESYVSSVAHLGEIRSFFCIYGSKRLRPLMFWLNHSHALVVFHVYCELE